MRPFIHWRLLHWLLCLLALFPVLTVEGASRRKISKDAEPVSIVALIGDPGRYDGHHIQTMGFLDVEFEGNALYLHEEDYRYSLSKNAIELVLTKAQEDQFNKLTLKHVIVEGTFSASGDEMYSGSLRGITRLEIWPVYGHR